jgi:hypothetical protein
LAVSCHLLDKTTACPDLKPIANAFVPDPKDTPERTVFLIKCGSKIPWVMVGIGCAFDAGLGVQPPIRF